MALDVHLTREVNERWGFDLAGGAEIEMPITVMKLQPSSPASRAGLQNGDTILTIDGEEAIDFTHEEACRRVAECADSLTFGVMRGLYDPVLDDHEGIYYEPGDLDPESQPTEVPFKVQRFVEPEDLGSSLIENGTISDPCGTPFDPNALNGTNTDPCDISFDPSKLLIDSRSQTASPFLASTKPYRPFSTEPLPEIPPLEEPIILNPNYKDQFGEALKEIDPDYILNAHIKNGFEGKYKLPISEQYDPDGTKLVQNAEIHSVLSKYLNMEALCKKAVSEQCTQASIDMNKDVKSSISIDSKEIIIKDVQIQEISKETREECTKVTSDISTTKEVSKKDVKISEKVEIVSKKMEEKVINEELKYIEKMKQEIDLAQIEETAISIVDDSIERAVSVTKEIKKEMEEELSGIDKSESKSEEILQSDVKKSTEVTETEVVDSKTETLDSKKDEKKITKEDHTEDVEKKMAESEIKESRQESEQSENVIRKESKAFVSSEEYQETVVKESPRKESISQEIKHSEKTGESKRTTKTVTSETKFDKAGAQQRTYTLGLQTIPNIRGVAHSSYHYDLLLRTFFIHLTDVMVALSRFILTQPVFNTESSESRQTVSETQMYESEMTDKKSKQESVSVAKQRVDKKAEATEQRVEERREVVKPVQEIKVESKKVEEVKIQEQKIQKRELVTPVVMEENHIQKQVAKADLKESQEFTKMEVREERKEETETAIVAEKKIATGAEMAQRTEKKLTKEMTQKLDAVISEFEFKAVDEDKRSRRSRSRSQIEEEVAKESDPLEWLSKVDSRRASQEISEERLSKKEYSSSETVDKKHSEKLERQEIIHKKSKTPKQMYRAIVESHVYTNKDVIFEDAAEFSETSSVVSAEEVNTAVEALETMSTENVALEAAVQQIEEAKIVEETQELAKVNAQSAALVQSMEEVVHETKKIEHEEYKKEVAKESTDIQQVIIQETKEIIEPVVELKETTIKKEAVSVDISKSLSIAESNEVNIQEAKSEITSVQSKQKTVGMIEEDYKEKVVAEAKVEVLESKKTDTKKVEEESAALKIVKEVETEIEKEIIEVEESLDVSKSLDQQTIINKIDISKENSEYGISKVEVSESKMTSVIEGIEKYKSLSTQEIIQEASFLAKSVDKKLSLRTDLAADDQGPPSTIDTPTPATVPPTPLTDEYVFKLTIPLPKSRSATPIPRDCTLSPEDEDPQIVKKKLIPYIETSIEKSIIYDPPLPTPPGYKVQSPIFKTPGLFGGASKPIYKIRFPPGFIYRKPGLFGGADNPELCKEEIREIERKSSLLASAIDETIKSIEEYKEEVGMETKKETKVTFKEGKVESYREEVIKSKHNGTTIEEISEKSAAKIETNGINQNTSIMIEENGAEITSEDTKVENNNIAEVASETLTGNQNAESKITTEAKKEIVFKETQLKKVDVAIEEPASLQNHISESRIETEAIKEKPVEQTQLNKDFAIEEPVRPQQSNVDTTFKIVSVSEKQNDKESKISVELKEVPKCVIEVPKIVQARPEEKRDPMDGYRPVVFEPDAIQRRGAQYVVMEAPTTKDPRGSPYLTPSGEIIGTVQGIVDGLEDPVMDEEVAKEIGKPGISEDKIAELISGEAEMLREAHVMGLARVLNSHMHRADDSSVDFQKIKPMLESLKDSEVLKVLNEELLKKREEEKKKEEKKWTTFLQKPKRNAPKPKFGYYGWTQAEQALVLEPYKVKIVKQAKPKVAPDYKPEDFETGPLPWEQRAEFDASLPPVEPEEPILVPELPEYFEAVDPLKESEVPDLEDTGIPLPPPREPTPPIIEPEEEPQEEQAPEVQEVEEEEEVTEVKEETSQDMESRLAQQLVKSVQDMVDPNASIDQQLCQMRAQLAALAQLPEVIQQTLALVSNKLNKISTQETHVEMSASQTENHQEIEVTQNQDTEQNQENQVCERNEVQNQDGAQDQKQIVTIQEMEEVELAGQQDQQVCQQVGLQVGQQMGQHENRQLQTPIITEEDMRMEKMKKEQKLAAESRQLKQRPTPRACKPKRVFGPPDNEVRPVVLPGGRRWRNTTDVFNEETFKETMQAQSELIMGKALGFESNLLPFDNSINFKKYEKPPVSLDHLKNSETYKMIHDMDQMPLKRVEMRTPVIAEADYRERCRSMTPAGAKQQIPQQFHP